MAVSPLLHIGLSHLYYCMYAHRSIGWIDLSKYVAESATTDCRVFLPCRPCQLFTNSWQRLMEPKRPAIDQLLLILLPICSISVCLISTTLQWASVTPYTCTTSTGQAHIYTTTDISRHCIQVYVIPVISHMQAVIKYFEMETNGVMSGVASDTVLRAQKRVKKNIVFIVWWVSLTRRAENRFYMCS